MSPKPRRQNDKDSMHPSVRALENVIKSMQQLGFEVESREFSLRAANHRLQVDLLLSRSGKQYALEVKSSGKSQVAFMNLLPRAILRLQAVERIDNLAPIVAMAIPRLQMKDVQRMAEYMNLYAPELGWLILDGHGKAVFKDSESEQHAVLNEGDVKWFDSSHLIKDRFYSYSSEAERDRLKANDNIISRAYSDSISALRDHDGSISPSIDSPPSPSDDQLSFSDSEQWLIKVFLMSSVDSAFDYWGGPQGHAQNAFQLSKLAEVSAPIAHYWAKSMKSSGYLKRLGSREMRPLRSSAIIEEWVGRYRFSDNRLFSYRSMYPISNHDAFFDEISSVIRERNKELGSIAITAHQACKLFKIKHSAARSIHIYCWSDIQEVARILSLVPSDKEEDADLFLVEPKYPKSVFGGVLRRGEIPVCDILQCYLDLFHLPDRGREQADAIYENIISEILRIRQSNANWAI